MHPDPTSCLMKRLCIKTLVLRILTVTAPTVHPLTTLKPRLAPPWHLKILATIPHWNLQPLSSYPRTLVTGWRQPWSCPPHRVLLLVIPRLPLPSKLLPRPRRPLPLRRRPLPSRLPRPLSVVIHRALLTSSPSASPTPTHAQLAKPAHRATLS